MSTDYLRVLKHHPCGCRDLLVSGDMVRQDHCADHAYMSTVTLRCIYCQRTITYPATEVWPGNCVHCSRSYAYTAERPSRPTPISGETESPLLSTPTESTSTPSGPWRVVGYRVVD